MIPVNFREFELILDNRTFSIAGMAHPILYNYDEREVLSFLKGKKYKTIVSFEAESSSDLAALCQKFEIAHHLIKIVDFGFPTLEDINRLKSILLESNAGEGIALHCMGGNGRTGTMLAALKIISHIDNIISQDELDAYDYSLIDKISLPNQEKACSSLVAQTILFLRNLPLVRHSGHKSVESDEQVRFLNMLEETLINERRQIMHKTYSSCKPS